MSASTIPTHSEIDPRFTWNEPSVFPTPADWEAEYRSVSEALDGLKQYVGRLAESPAVLAAAFTALQDIMARVGKLYTYAGMSYAVDTTDQEAAKRNGRAMGLYGQAMAAIAFVDPELLGMGEAKLRGWVAEDPALAYLGQPRR